MTAKEYLKQYEDAQKRIRRCRKEYEEEMLKIDATRSPSSSDGMPHGSGISKPTEEKAIRLEAKAAKWKIAELEAIEIRQEVFAVINRIPGDEGDLLFDRYIELKKFETIATEMHYSLRGIYAMHSRALKMVEKHLCI